MKVSLDWLRQYVDIDIKASELADLITMAGLEVEAVIDPYEQINSVKVGRITDISPHPNADKLVCCKVDIGSSTTEIVCGAPNVKKGMNVPCATLGTILPSGIEVKKAKIRGQTSEGMLCSRVELGLGDDASGLMELEQTLAPGIPLKEALGFDDTVFELGLTPNRPDCLCHIGVAREIAALLGKNLMIRETSKTEGSGHTADNASVVIENPDLCPRYSARLVSDIAIGPSPAWMQQRLRAIGLKPINNIVDITNYVLMETGQPLHAFDFDRLAGHRIVVRTPHEQEDFFTTLDGKSRQLDSETLLICDAEKPVAIAGVMGGGNSEIMESTKRVLIESACFDPVSIRKTAKRIGASTDASYRFERGVDPKGTVYAMNRAADLIAELAGGSVTKGIIDEHPRPSVKKTITLSTEKTNRHLGTCLEIEKIAGHLESIGFSVYRSNSDQLEVTSPTFRVDVERPEDLMEEVARLNGYNRISTTFPQITAQAEPPGRTLETKERIRDMMSGFGFHETINYSFAAARGADRLELPAGDPRRKTVEIMNPLSEEQAVMRTTLLPGLLETTQKNIFRQEKNLKLFEIGKAFYKAQDRELPHETEMLTALWTGMRKPLAWHTGHEHCDFYDIKGTAESLLAGLGIKDAAGTKMPDSACSYTQPGRTAQIRLNDIFLGLIGEIRPSVLKRFDIRQPVFVLEIHLEALIACLPGTHVFRQIPKFPAVTRDITLIVDSRIEAGQIIDHVKATDTDLIENVFMFDVYSGKPIAEGKKSISLRIVYRSFDRTLEDARVNEIHQRITDDLLSAFDAALPA
ncbi:MAG: phenylalanine--tRNA ligase subunit beta [Desulfobacteraceae bacterium]|nr:phenylalanine--tRNA ligase subunit beta [Desulfobacteraceae bacterium]MCF8095658.1 phenylalanine--tRNA ligase subunit beta [Desulfobacteraceae bacterium]